MTNVLRVQLRPINLLKFLTAIKIHHAVNQTPLIKDINTLQTSKVYPCKSCNSLPNLIQEEVNCLLFIHTDAAVILGI